MDIIALKEELINRGFNMECLSVGERDPYGEDKFTVNFEENLWQVYYVERGRKFDVKFFSSESEACLFFLDWVMSKHYLFG